MTAVSGSRNSSSRRRAAVWRPAFRLIRALLRHHKRLFFTAVAGAAVFAACTVLSADDRRTHHRRPDHAPLRRGFGRASARWSPCSARSSWSASCALPVWSCGARGPGAPAGASPSRSPREVVDHLVDAAHAVAPPPEHRRPHHPRRRRHRSGDRRARSRCRSPPAWWCWSCCRRSGCWSPTWCSAWPPCAVFPVLIALNLGLPAPRRPLLQHRPGRARQAQRGGARELRRRGTWSRRSAPSDARPSGWPSSPSPA